MYKFVPYRYKGCLVFSSSDDDTMFEVSYNKSVVFAGTWDACISFIDGI